MTVTKQELHQLLTTDLILDIAGAKFFVRGEDYYTAGAVQDMVEARGAIKAIVSGTHDYKVTIRVHQDELDYDCNCPVGQDGLFCKHLVATGLAWLAENTDTTPAKGKTVRKKTKRKKPDIFAQLQTYLDTRDKKALISMIIEQAENDAGFRNMLTTKALSKLPANQMDLDAHKEFIRKMIQVNGAVDYHGMSRYLQRAWPVVYLLEELLKDGYAEQVARLADYALQLGFTAYQKVDDSGGSFGSILQSISGLHLDACTQSNPDPHALAKALFKLETKDDWGIIHFESYAELLNKTGLQQFKQLAQKMWSKVPVRKNKDEKNLAFGEYFTITRLMERLALLEADIESLLEIKKRDLSCAYRYCEIATLYSEAERFDEALQWAETGLSKFSKDLDYRLNEFLISEYQRRTQHDKAIQLAWQQFTRQPRLTDYQQLISCANKADATEFWREKALQWLRKDYLPKLNSEKQPRWQWVARGHSLLVEIFLWESAIDKALHEANSGGCAEHLWFTLAKACERSHPREAIKIYQDRIGGIIGQTNNNAYDRAAEILTKIKELMTSLKQTTQFDAYAEQLRVDYKQKRNFIKKIESI